MGFLHKGHLSLVKKAREESDIVIASIFVNPTQFAPNEDLAEYPRDFEHDKQLLEKENCDIIFYPSVEEMYPEKKLTWVEVKELTNKRADVYCLIGKLKEDSNFLKLELDKKTKLIQGHLLDLDIIKKNSTLELNFMLNNIPKESIINLINKLRRV